MAPFFIVSVMSQSRSDERFARNPTTLLALTVVVSDYALRPRPHR